MTTYLTREEALALRDCGRPITLSEAMELKFWEAIKEMTDENGVVHKPVAPRAPPLHYDASGNPVFYTDDMAGDYE